MRSTRRTLCRLEMSRKRCKTAQMSPFSHVMLGLILITPQGCQLMLVLRLGSQNAPAEQSRLRQVEAAEEAASGCYCVRRTRFHESVDGPRILAGNAHEIAWSSGNPLCLRWEQSECCRRCEVLTLRNEARKREVHVLARGVRVVWSWNVARWAGTLGYGL